MRDKAYEICRTYLSGQWDNISANDMVVKTISGGYSSQLYYCSLPDTHEPIDNEPRDVVYRLYGEAVDGDDYKVTNSLITMLLSERRLGPKLYGVFAGGRLEEYIKSRPMAYRELRDPDYMLRIAKQLAQIHSMDVPIAKHPHWLFDTMDQYWAQVVAYTPDPNRPQLIPNPSLERELCAFDYKSESQWLRQLLSTCGSPVVFSHNDLSEGNILIPEDSTAYEDGMVFIDFEFAAYNYRGFDLGDYFTEYQFDYTNPEYPHYYAHLDAYPSDHEKRLFIREYIRHSTHLTSGRQTEDRLVREADYFALASHLLWWVWGILKARTSRLRYGYWV
ncbi:unnamed protein product [Oppiella nova]|nr:unnamed protein product [Oppiella nova]CAG2178785.1 unnamed protein product [Oppiella nova]